MRRSFTMKYTEKKSRESSLVLQNLKTEMKFLLRAGACNTLFNANDLLLECKVDEPIYMIGKPEPSPKVISSSPPYSLKDEGLLRLDVT